MKTDAIRKQILNNYKQLSQLAHVNPEKENIVPIWGLIYKKANVSGFVNQIGVIERNHTAIRIVNEKKKKKKKKPFYLTWKSTLKKINSMLKDTIKNIDNNKVVTKKFVNVLCFPESFTKKLAEINKNLK